VDLYLIQHGQALSAEQDPQRPLSEEGRATATKIADRLAASGARLIDPALTEIRHSGKLRAQQTAEVFAQALCPNVTPEASPGMNPNDDPRKICGELAGGTRLFRRRRCRRRHKPRDAVQ
jgi:phosphohistidine phosphatase